mmetsp:Transcript_60804/g.181161  ORF Transcript_60804/g.181161 Transcript_60804/m.181161 type:complete len:212 (-) Transcript_60804:535-1170(-)
MASMAVKPTFSINNSSSFAESPSRHGDFSPQVSESVPTANGMPLAFAIFTASAWESITTRPLAWMCGGIVEMALLTLSTTSIVGTSMAPFSFMRSAASSSRKEPCSIVPTPARSAAMMPGFPWQWAATKRSLRWASSTMVRISSSLNCWWIGLSISVSTPPDAQILISLAPRRMFLRTAFRHSWLPSQQHITATRLSSLCSAAWMPRNSMG